MKSFLNPWAGFFFVIAGGGAGWRLGSIANDETEVSFLSVGQGDCTVLSSQGYTILIDDGPASARENAGERIVIPWLQSKGYHSVDAILLSHPDEDHVGGTPIILNRFPAAKLIISDVFRSDPEMERRLNAWRMDPDQITWLPKFCELQVGRADLTIECPDRPAGEDANNGSMFVKIKAGEGSVTLSGDAPKKVEREVETDEDWSAEILHVGHHGSHTATDESWLECVRPKYAVISVGRNNRYGHPSPETLNRLTSFGIPILRTDRDGTITFHFDGRTFRRD